MNPVEILMAYNGVPVSDVYAMLWGRMLAESGDTAAPVCGKNLWTGKNLTKNRVIDGDDGVEKVNANYVISDFYPNTSKLYTVSFKTSYEDWRILSIALYDSNKKFISLIRKAACHVGKWTFTFSAGEAAYFRISLFRLDEEVQLEAGSEATDYVPYSGNN